MYMAFIGPIIVKFYPDWLFRDGLSHPATVIALIHHIRSLSLDGNGRMDFGGEKGRA